MSKAIPYRPEVDGLRTIAILPVLLFHLGFAWIEGGFLGVDVFFVISGYLITSIIIKESSEGKFTFRGFWMRRIRRIFPVLTMMLLVTSVAAFFLSFRPELEQYGKIAAAALLSLANIVIWRTSGSYWGASAEDSPFLHTWSLSVEEQFYIFYPFVLLFILKRKVKLLPWLLGGFCIGGFCFFVAASKIFPTACFYLLPTRAWELGIGCLVAIFHFRGLLSMTNGQGIVASSVGLALIVCSYFFVSGENGISSLQAFAVIGSGMIVANRNPVGPIYKFLACKPMVFVGKISYSLYVWHWPVIVLGKPYFGGRLHAYGMWPTLVLVAVFSVFSYYLIEQRTRKMTRIVPFVLVTLSLSLGMALFLGYGNYTKKYDTSGFKDSSYYGQLYDLSPLDPPIGNDVKLKRLGIEAPGRNYSVIEGLFKKGGLVAGATANPVEIAVFGDSHSLMWAKTLSEIGKELEVGIALNGMQGTTPFFEIPIQPNQMGSPRYKGSQKVAFDQARLDLLERLKPSLLIISTRWSQRDHEEARSLLEHTSRLGIAVLLLEQVPELFISNNNASQYFAFMGLDELPGNQQIVPMGNVAKFKRGQRLVSQLNQKYEHVTVLHLSKYLLNNEEMVQVVKEGQILYYDDDHLSYEGASVLKPVVKKAISELLEVN